MCFLSLSFTKYRNKKRGPLFATLQYTSCLLVICDAATFGSHRTERVKLKNDGKKEERQCTLKGKARYVNVRGSVHWKGVYRVGDRDLGMQNL